jgi:hypothetical protein
MIKKLLILSILSLPLFSSSNPLNVQQIKQMDQQYTKSHATKRTFKSKEEFQRTQHTSAKSSSRSIHSDSRYDRGRDYNNPDSYQQPQRYHRQRPYRYSKRGWELAYRYDRADFYDQDGYYYGYFNRYGFYFEERFYRYDRHYSYRDRVRGRGLFDHYYYMPADARYYGFSR